MLTNKDTQGERKRDRCEEFLKRWTKENAKSLKKVDHIMDTLGKCGFDDLKHSAERFIKFFDGKIFWSILVKGYL